MKLRAPRSELLSCLLRGSLGLAGLYVLTLFILRFRYAGCVWPWGRGWLVTQRTVSHPSAHSQYEVEVEIIEAHSLHMGALGGAIARNMAALASLVQFRRRPVAKQ